MHMRQTYAVVNSGQDPLLTPRLLQNNASSQSLKAACQANTRRCI